MTHERGLLHTASDLLVPIHRDGHKFLGVTLAATVVSFLLWPDIGWLFLAISAWIAFAFRDPERITPVRDGLVIAPADGRIGQIASVAAPPELGLGGDVRTRVPIHLSPFDVHVNRAPVSGRIVRSVYVPGAFLNPTLDKASEENERRGLVIETAEGEEVAVVQIAGVVSRRIVTFAGEGDTVAAGQRFGLIRLGSRVDLYLPPGCSPLVTTGQRAVAGETVLCDAAARGAAPEFRRS